MADNGGKFMIRQWEDIKKGGGLAISIQEINSILKGDTEEMLSREEVIDRVSNYFNSCLRITEDADTGEQITTWAKNPTKSGLALALGIDKQTLLDYTKGINSKNQPYRNDAYSHRRISNNDFDILRKAYTIIECFYEEELGKNKNNAGVIYWLNNCHNSKWSNEQEFKFGAISDEIDKRPVLSCEDLPRLNLASNNNDD